eukprot:7218787-Pyramimonas_sp.AAC.1
MPSARGHAGTRVRVSRQASSRWGRPPWDRRPARRRSPPRSHRSSRRAPWSATAAPSGPCSWPPP